MDANGRFNGLWHRIHAVLPGHLPFLSSHRCLAQETQPELRKVNANPGFRLSEPIVTLRCLAEGEGRPSIRKREVNRMFRRPMTRLAVTAAAAGTICALGASAASAAPHATWSGGRTVPGAITNESPTVTSITFPVAGGQGQIVGWRGRSASGPILYKYKVPGLNKGHWSATGRVPGRTSSAPAFGSYRDP